MANGDIASGLGWTVNAGTDDRRNGWDRINYALDRAAEQRLTLRDTVLPAINQPVFSVRKADYPTSIPNNSYQFLNGNTWGGPIINEGFRWLNGQLTVAKAGVYRVSTGVQYVHNDRDMVSGVQVVRNTSTPNTANTLVKAEFGGRGAAKTELVRLVAGDVLSMLIYASHTTNVPTSVDNNPFAMSMSVEWVRP